MAGVAAPSLDALAAELAVSATFGLALAATPEAEQMLSSLANDPAAFAAVKRAAPQALALARTVRAQGLQAYYGSECEAKSRPDR